MKWKRMPETFGFYWFTKDPADWDLASIIPVSRHEYGDGTVELTRSATSPEKLITPKEGWWLRIVDERRNAEFEK